VDRQHAWRLIEQARLTAAGDCEGEAAVLVEVLSRLAADEIRGFQAVLDELMDESYRWDLWDAANLINSGCSDDLFDYFRAWLIAQGEYVYQSVLASPDSLASHPVAGREDTFLERIECEGFLYVALDAYEKVAGQKMARERRLRGVPKGIKQQMDDEADAKGRFPRLWAALRLDET
jgi:hypothetical protein